MKESKQHMQALWDNYKSCHIHIMGIPEGEERTEGIFEAVMTEKFL